ncbi:MAG TPA: DUF2868 domain-containing protein [Planctomycetota bacterium]|nr:DUF2868 domain-containing protein [Planctomycetota bacterium]
MIPLRLSDLIDLEARTLAEQGDSEEVRRSRYRHLGRRLADQGPLPEDPGALLRALLRLEPPPNSPGKRFESTLRLFQSLLAVGGLLAGGSLSLGLLHGSDGGQHPVNVLTVLAALVGTQLVLLLLLIVALIPHGDARPSGPVQHLLRAGFEWLLRRAGAADRMGAIEDRLTAHRGLLKWILVRSAQIFGVAFNLSAFACMFFRFATFDVSFGWSTTLGLTADSVHRMARVVAAPWHWLSPRLAPDLQTVQASQYSHLEGTYVFHADGSRSAGIGLVGAWWSFVLSALLTYGLLPRFLALMVSSVRVRRILSETPEHNVDLVRLCEWIRSPVVSTRPEGPEPAAHPVASASASAEPPLPPAGTACELLDGAPAGVDQVLRDRFGWTVAPGPDRPLVAIVSAWEEPTKGQLRKFSELRERLANRILILGLRAAAGGDDARREKIRERWKRDLPKALDGVRIRVEAL